MEIADNQHPIDLSRKCGYYEESSDHHQRYVKPSSVDISSRPLPGLIPISSLLYDSKSTTKDRRISLSGPSFTDRHYTPLKERSTSSCIRKEVWRQRSTPQLSITSKMRKSNSDNRICSLKIDGGGGGGSATFANYSNVPMHSATSRKYADSDKAGLVYNSSCFASTRFGEEEVSSSGFTQSKKYVKQGPGVSLTTIQSLRKLLDKRKSMQRDS